MAWAFFGWARPEQRTAPLPLLASPALGKQRCAAGPARWVPTAQAGQTAVVCLLPPGRRMNRISDTIVIASKIVARAAAVPSWPRITVA